MKTQTGIWIDASKAIIVRMIHQKEHVTEIHADIENHVYHHGEGDKGTFMGSRHINNENTFDEKRKHQIEKYLKEVIDLIEHDDEIYIFGPAEIKSKLKHEIEKDKLLVDKLKLVETADKMTNNQIVAKVKAFYNIPNH